MRYSLLVLLIVALAPALVSLGQNTNTADAWSDFAQHHPVADISTNAFVSLRAEVIANRLRISFSDPKPDKELKVRLVASADVPGHWPARDWQSSPMRATAAGWEAALPVEDLDVPIIYYVTNARSNTSPMRIVHPRKAGLEEPTRIFWPFIEGFEDGTDGWRALDEETALQQSMTAHVGKSALAVSVDAAKRSTTIATTRIRGWQVHGQRALGLRFWARKAQGEGRIRASLLANAFTARQTIATFPNEPKLGSRWQQIDLPFASLPPFPMPDLDLVTLELIGPGEYLIDDLELLGPWDSETH